MTQTDLALDYAPRPPSFRRSVIERVATALRRTGWLIARRPLGAIDVFVGGWLLVATCWDLSWTPLWDRAWPSIAGARLIVYTVGWGTPIGVATLVVSFFALIRLTLRRRWRAVVICISVALLAGIASGAVQTERCPHATYLQFFGSGPAIWGKPCRNPQMSCPWWLRK